jgi:hypothetical protein
MLAKLPYLAIKNISKDNPPIEAEEIASRAFLRRPYFRRPARSTPRRMREIIPG